MQCFKMEYGSKFGTTESASPSCPKQTIPTVPMYVETLSPEP